MKNLKVNLTYLEEFVLICDAEFKQMVLDEIIRIRKELQL